MKRLRKPFFSGKGVSKTRKKYSNNNIWSAIKLLFSISIERRSPSSFIYLLLIGVSFGGLFIVIGFVVLSHFGVNDQRTIILFSILYFIYGFCMASIQNVYIIPLGTARVYFLITFVFFFLFTNLLACWLGFNFIPWR